MNGLDYFGADVAPQVPPTVSWRAAGIAVGAGVVASQLIRKHPVLAFLGGAAMASNTHAIVTKRRSVHDAVRRLGCHAIAIVGALAMPAIPWAGYIAGAIAADMLIDGDGGGIVEEWLPCKEEKPPARDVTPITPDDQTKTLVASRKD